MITRAIQMILRILLLSGLIEVAYRILIRHTILGRISGLLFKIFYHVSKKGVKIGMKYAKEIYKEQKGLEVAKVNKSSSPIIKNHKPLQHLQPIR